MRYEEALEGLRSGWGFFGVVPRITRGNKKKDCVPYFDALWADIDDVPEIDPYVFLDETKEKLPDDLHPSVVVYTGNKGLHCYWKLDSMLPIEYIEHWCKVIAHAVGGDNCHDRTRILAHSGVPHRTTGKLVEIIEFTAEVHPAQRLRQLPEIPRPTVPKRTRPRRATDTGPQEEWLSAAEALNGWGDPPEINLWARFSGSDLGYLRGSYRKGWNRGKQTRSEVEMSIVYRLVGEGASDEQIRDLADAYFSKHIEESRKRGYRYIDRTISSARKAWYEKGWLTHPLGGGRKKREAKYRASTVSDLELYLELVKGQLLSEWVGEVVGTGKGRASAYRSKDGLEAIGLVEVRDRHIFRTDSSSPQAEDD